MFNHFMLPPILSYMLIEKRGLFKCNNINITIPGTCAFVRCLNAPLRPYLPQMHAKGFYTT